MYIYIQISKQTTAPSARKKRKKIQTKTVIWLGDILPDKLLPARDRSREWSRFCVFKRGCVQFGEQRKVETAQTRTPSAGEKEKGHVKMTWTRSCQESALSQQQPHEDTAEVVLTVASVSSGTARCVVSNPVCLSVLPSCSESQRREKENDTT